MLQTLIAASKFFVSVKIIGFSAVEPEASSSSKRLSVGSNEPEWRETIGELEFRLGENAEKVLPGKEVFRNAMGGTFWIYFSEVNNCSFIYFEVDKVPGEMLF